MQNPNSETVSAITVATPDTPIKTQNFDIMGFAPMILVFIVFYFMIFRPQQQKIKSHKTLLEKLQRGDHVLTEGGIFATVYRVVNDSEIQVEIAENIIIRMRRSAVVDIISKPEIQSKSIEQKDKKKINSSQNSKKK